MMQAAVARAVEDRRCDPRNWEIVPPGNERLSQPNQPDGPKPRFLVPPPSATKMVEASRGC